MEVDVPEQLLERRAPWRFDELDDLPDDGRRYEVVDGNLVVSPGSGQFHQLVSQQLRDALEAEAPHEWAVFNDFALSLGTDGRIPDLAVVRNQPISRTEKYPLGPEHVGLVAEVVSPGSRKTDRFAKPGDYAEAGIGLYWRVELEPEVLVHAFVLDGEAYVPVDGLLTPWGPLRAELAF